MSTRLFAGFGRRADLLRTRGGERARTFTQQNKPSGERSFARTGVSAKQRKPSGEQTSVCHITRVESAGDAWLYAAPTGRRELDPAAGRLNDPTVRAECEGSERPGRWERRAHIVARSPGPAMGEIPDFGAVFARKQPRSR
jgi:hypothetical protein